MIVTSDGQMTPQTPSDHIQLALVACREKQSYAQQSNNREQIELFLSHEEHLLELLIKASVPPLMTGGR
jgi:hypothetical protein